MNGVSTKKAQQTRIHPDFNPFFRHVLQGFASCLINIDKCFSQILHNLKERKFIVLKRLVVLEHTISSLPKSRIGTEKDHPSFMLYLKETNTPLVRNFSFGDIEFYSIL